MSELSIIGKNAQEAKRILALSSHSARMSALNSIADALLCSMDDLLAANSKDLDAGKAAGLSAALLDRLALSPERISGIASSIRDISALPDPLGRVLSEVTRPNGLLIRKISVPIGVIAVIYEARPNVTADSAVLCLMSGNACILRGGKEAINSNMAIALVMRAAIEKAGLPANCVQLISDVSRESAAELMRMRTYVDLLIPRGGRGLIQNVVDNSTVPVIQTGAGVCHTYVDKAADVLMAADIIFNAKTSRPSVCNALECILVHRDIAQSALPLISARLDKKHVQLRADAATLAIVPSATPAVDADWGSEYGDYILACKVVGSIDEAIAHIQTYGTGHSECIITQDTAAAQTFMAAVDAAAVYVNASTRFTDGGEFGLGAEIGISTQKLHARGPLGLNELTSVKYMVFGSGQIR
ncbi:MAG: glutamate-5-semialdehyde dehydrogenase [Clostridia bacterium]